MRIITRIYTMSWKFTIAFYNILRFNSSCVVGLTERTARHAGRREWNTMNRSPSQLCMLSQWRWQASRRRRADITYISSRPVYRHIATRRDGTRRREEVRYSCPSEASMPPFLKRHWLRDHSERCEWETLFLLNNIRAIKIAVVRAECRYLWWTTVLIWR